MQGRKNRDIKSGVTVKISEVKKSGLIKDSIELRTPKQATDTKHQDLTQACSKLANYSKLWTQYYLDNKQKGDCRLIVPLMVVQVEDKVSKDTLGALCSQICKTLPWLDKNECFANVFGEHEDIKTSSGIIRYIKPENVSEHEEVKILFAKDAVSTGWDCPRAEVIYSRRKRTDPTYIAQLIGRMVRTPLARRITNVEALNTVSCYLPEYDASTVESVVAKLKEDHIDETSDISVNTVDVGFYGDTKKVIEAEIAKHEKTTSVDMDNQKVIASATTDEYRSFIPGSQWRISSHDSSRHGSTFLKAILCENRFPFPKSLYAVHDALRFFVDKKPEALIIDFFSGSGTTLHAVNLMNEVDGGKRRCICVTNNEISAEEEKAFRLKGLRPYDEEWDKYGIARYVTWPRTMCSIKGHDINGKPLDGDYGKPSKEVDLGYSLPKADGFKANAIFCELTYESAWPIRLDNAFDAIAPILWMLAGCRGPIIRRLGKSYLTTDYYGVLFDYSQASKFCEKVKSTPTIKTAFVVTDDQRRYRNQPKNLRASISIPYPYNGHLEPNYPDFIFFQKVKDKIKPAIVDPHGDWMGDSIAKLRGYVMYLKDHPTMFSRVLAVTDEKKGEIRYLDLMKKDVQDAIETFTGDTAKTLFTGPLSQKYN